MARGKTPLEAPFAGTDAEVDSRESGDSKRPQMSARLDDCSPSCPPIPMSAGGIPDRKLRNQAVPGQRCAAVSSYCGASAIGTFRGATAVLSPAHGS